MQGTNNLLLLCILILILSEDKKINKKTTQSCDNSIPIPTKRELESQILNFPEYTALLNWKLEDTYNVVKNHVDCVPRNLAIAGVLKHPELRNLFKITNAKGNSRGVTGTDIWNNGMLQWIHIIKNSNYIGPKWTDQSLADYILEYLVATIPVNKCVTCRLEHNTAPHGGHIITVCRVKNDNGSDALKVIDSQVKDFPNTWRNYAGDLFIQKDGSYTTSLIGEDAKEYFTNTKYIELDQIWRQDKFSIIENNFHRLKYYNNPAISKDTKEDKIELNKAQTCPWCKRSFKDLRRHQKHCKKNPALNKPTDKELTSTSAYNIDKIPKVD